MHSFHSFTDFTIIQSNGFHRKHRIFLWFIGSRAPVRLDGYVLYQFLAIAVTLWIVKKSIVDDNKLTLDEGFSIILIHSLGILLFDELSLLIWTWMLIVTSRAKKAYNLSIVEYGRWKRWERISLPNGRRKLAWSFWRPVKSWRVFTCYSTTYWNASSHLKMTWNSVKRS